MEFNFLFPPARRWDGRVSPRLMKVNRLPNESSNLTQQAFGQQWRRNLYFYNKSEITISEWKVIIHLQSDVFNQSHWLHYGPVFMMMRTGRQYVPWVECWFDRCQRTPEKIFPLGNFPTSSYSRCWCLGSASTQLGSYNYCVPYLNSKQ